MKLLLHLLTSLHGPSRHFGKTRNLVAIRAIADMAQTCCWLDPVANDPACVKTHRLL
jgi:hypothetical protein